MFKKQKFECGDLRNRIDGGGWGFKKQTTGFYETEV